MAKLQLINTLFEWNEGALEPHKFIDKDDDDYEEDSDEESKDR